MGRRPKPEDLRRLLDWATEAGIVPGAVVRVEREGRTIVEASSGWAMLLPERRPMRPDCLFDLASVTKPVATSTSIMILVERGEVSLDTPVGSLVPEFRGGHKGEVTIRHLLAHTSGLPAHLRFYETLSGKEEIVRAVCKTPLEALPGKRFRYSDLGFILLGEVVERASGVPLDRFCKENIFDPLGMRDTCFKPDLRRFARRLVATEFCKWRGRVICGEVHDENAYAMGEVAGHAGLFSTARDLTTFLRMLLNEGELDGVRILRPESVRLMFSPLGGPVSHFGLGWHISAPVPSFSERTFWHSGFTGTFVCADPEGMVTVVLLTNRIHPSRETPGFLQFRSLALQVARETAEG